MDVKLGRRWISVEVYVRLQLQLSDLTELELPKLYSHERINLRYHCVTPPLLSVRQ